MHKSRICSKIIWCKGKKWKANLVALVSETILAVCSGTALLLYSSIYKRSAGLGTSPGLLLADPALSFPNMPVIRGVIGTQKTVVYVSLVVIMATISGLIYGYLF